MGNIHVMFFFKFGPVVLEEMLLKERFMDDGLCTSHKSSP